MVKFLKNCPKTIFDSSNEAFCCTERNAKDPSSLKIMVSEKVKKNSNNYHFWCFWLELDIFGGYS